MPGMATVEQKLQVGHAYPPGTQVTVHPRLSDVVEGTPPTRHVDSTTVDGGGWAKVKGLIPHGPYVLSGTVTEVAPGLRDKNGDPVLVERVQNVNFNAVDESDIPHEDVRNASHQARAQAHREGAARARMADSLPEVDSAPVVKTELRQGARNTLDRPKSAPSKKSESKPSRPAARKGK